MKFFLYTWSVVIYNFNQKYDIDYGAALTSRLQLPSFFFLSCVESLPSTEREFPKRFFIFFVFNTLGCSLIFLKWSGDSLSCHLFHLISLALHLQSSLYGSRRSSTQCNANIFISLTTYALQPLTTQPNSHSPVCFFKGSVFFLCII